MFRCFGDLFENGADIRELFLRAQSHTLHFGFCSKIFTHTFLRVFTTTSPNWEPAMLPVLLTRLPAHTPLSVYGIGPGWLYAALAAYANPRSFYLFDPKLPFGWISPVRVVLSTEVVQEEDLHLETTSIQGATILKISFPYDRLEYLRPEPLRFPSVPIEQGVIIDGRVPNWLLTALTQLYQTAGVAWIATFYPPLGKAVVVFSRRESPRPGDLVTIVGS
jgi:CRISPR-associated protein Csx3